MATFDITLDNGTASYSLTGTADKQKVLDTAEDAARYLYPKRWQLYDVDEEPILFDDLTNAQKQAVIAREFVYYMKECARTYHVTDASSTARDDAIEEADDKYDL